MHVSNFPQKAHILRYVNLYIDQLSFSLNPRGHYISASSVYAVVQAQKQIQNCQKTRKSNVKFQPKRKF